VTPIIHRHNALYEMRLDVVLHQSQPRMFPDFFLSFLAFLKFIETPAHRSIMLELLLRHYFNFSFSSC